MERITIRVAPPENEAQRKRRLKGLLDEHLLTRDNTHDEPLPPERQIPGVPDDVVLAAEELGII